METKQTIRQGIVSDDDVKELIRNVTGKNNWPQSIAETRLKIIEKKFEASQLNGVTETNEEIARIESEIFFEVTAETIVVNRDVDKVSTKLKFTNKEQREAETKRRCAEDSEHKAWSIRRRAALLKKAELDMEVDKLETTMKYYVNQFSAEKATIELVAGLCGEDINQVQLTALSHIKNMCKNFEKENGNG